TEARLRRGGDASRPGRGGQGTRPGARDSAIHTGRLKALRAHGLPHGGAGGGVFELDPVGAARREPCQVPENQVASQSAADKRRIFKGLVKSSRELFIIIQCHYVTSEGQPRAARAHARSLQSICSPAAAG